MKILSWVLAILVVTATLLVLADGAWVVCIDTDADRAHGQMRALREAVQAYRRDHGRLPESLEELLDLGPRNEPYVRTVPMDPWGHAYVRSTTDTADVRMACSGPDALPGTEDDLRWPPGDAR